MNIESKLDLQIKVLYLCGFLDLLAVSCILPLIPSQVKSLGVSYSLSGFIAAIYGAIQLFSSPSVGWWSDKWGRKPVLLLCLVISALSYGLLGLGCLSLYMIIISRIISGIFKHSQTISRSILADVTPSEQRSKIFGTFNATSSMGFIVGPTIGGNASTFFDILHSAGHLSEINNGFTLVCLVGSVIFFINLGLCFFFLPNTVGISSEKRFSSFIIEDLKWNFFGKIFLIRFLLGFAALVYRSNFSLLMEENFGYSPKTIGYLISFQGTIAALTGFFTGYISKFYKNPNQELLHSAFLLSFALIGVTFAPAPFILLLSLGLLCVSTAVIRVSGTAIVIARCSPDEIGAINGLGQSLTSIARMVTPVVAGISQQASRYGPGTVGAFSSLVGAVFVSTLVSKAKEE